MAVYTCKLGSPEGRVVEKEFDSLDSAVLRSSLEGQGFHVFELKKKSSLSGLITDAKNKRLDNRTLLSFNQEMLVLLKAGIPVLQVFDTILERHDNEKLAAVLRQVREDIKSGSSISAAMEKHGNVFPRLYIASIQAGERTGDLQHTIRRFIQYLKRMDEIRKKVVSAMFYPAIIVTVAFLAVTLLLVYVVPTFSQIYADAGSQLPVPTQILISVTTVLKKYFVFALLLLPLLFEAVRRWHQTVEGRYAVDSLKLRIPLLGDIYSKYSISAFTRTLATVLGSGIPVIESLRMSVGTLNNAYMEKKLYEAIRLIEEGGRISSAFDRIGIMSPLALRMLGAGETTGSLEDMLVTISDYIDEELSEKIQIMTTAIEPAVMVIMGIIIGTIIVTMYLPVFKIAGTIG